MTAAGTGCPETWERHPIYPHEGSSLGRARTLDGKILRQRPGNRPRDVPPEQRYRLMDVWIPGEDGEKGRRVTVSVHVFITECHWGLKKYRRQVARHRVSAGGGAADNRWENLLGWGFPEDNEADKPPAVRAAAARAARAAQLAALPRRKRRRRLRRVTLKVTFRLPWPQRKRRVTAGGKPVSKPVTKGRL